MVSGVGPASTLRQHNIPIVADVPGLGQNAEDQPFMALTYKVHCPERTDGILAS
jgi:choline dehydrogenase